MINDEIMILIIKMIPNMTILTFVLISIVKK